MRRTFACVGVLFTLIVSSLAYAQSVNIDFTDRGWYESTGIHFPSELNYVVGDERGAGHDAEYRDFFVFDLTGVIQPIVTAALALYLPSAGAGGFPGPLYSGYNSGDPSENFELHDVVTPIASLLDGTGGVAAWSDLGTGIVYGNRTVTAADQGKVMEITLNASTVAAMNSSHGLFGFGGSITTLDNLANNEWVFGWTNLGTEVTQLRLTLVPEPSTLLLLGIVGLNLLGFRKARSGG